MGIMKSAADLVYTIRFLKMLVTPFNKLGAFKYGIIDKDGKKLVKPGDAWFDDADNRRHYGNHWTSFIRLVINLKKLMAKVPGGRSGYGESCAPKGACTFGARLDAEEIDALATYVLDRAAVDWK